MRKKPQILRILKTASILSTSLRVTAQRARQRRPM
jgi:hypothetical protein